MMAPDSAPSILHSPLRAVLALTLIALIVVGVGLRVTTKSGSVTTTSTTTTSTPTSRSSTTSTTPPTTTTTVRSATAPPDFHDVAHGCGVAFSPHPGYTVRPHAIGHCTVLEIGDSLGADLGWGLAREIGGWHGITWDDEATSDTGLVAQWYYNWPSHLKTFLAQDHPNVVLADFGGNDQQGMKVNGVVESFASPAWDARYTSLVKQIDDMALKADAYVLWVGLPVMQPPEYNQGAELLNSIYENVARESPGVTYLSLWSLFANAAGQYEASAVVNGAPQVLRSSDGIHMSTVGENLEATYVAEKFGPIFDVVLPPVSQPAHIG